MTPVPLPGNDAQILDDLVNRLSHDLRSPVHAMTEIIDWIEEELTESPQGCSNQMSEFVTLLKNRGQRLKALISNLTTLAQVGHDPRVFDGNWDGVLERVMIKTTLRTAFEITTDFQCTPHIPSADIDVLVDVLVSNAIKHHPQKRGRIHLSAIQQSGGCLLVIEDDGAGIPDDRIEEALGMLTTLNRQDVVEGSGLGFSIAHRIVTSCEGTMTIGRASGGQGCKVSVFLPDAADVLG